MGSHITTFRNGTRQDFCCFPCFGFGHPINWSSPKPIWSITEPFWKVRQNISTCTNNRTSQIFCAKWSARTIYCWGIWQCPPRPLGKDRIPCKTKSTIQAWHLLQLQRVKILLHNQNHHKGQKPLPANKLIKIL